MSEWISVDDRLPEIPDGRNACRVLVVSFDQCYEEINPGKGSSVSTAMFMKTDQCDEPWFHCMSIGTPVTSKRRATRFAEWIIWCDEITHWQPLPEPPK